MKDKTFIHESKIIFWVKKEKLKGVRLLGTAEQSFFNLLAVFWIYNRAWLFQAFISLRGFNSYWDMQLMHLPLQCVKPFTS